MFEVDFNPIHPAQDRSRTVPQSAQGRGSPRSSDKSMPASMELHSPHSPGWASGGKLSHPMSAFLLWIFCYLSVQWGQSETGLATPFTSSPEAASVARTLKHYNKTKIYKKSLVKHFQKIMKFLHLGIMFLFLTPHGLNTTC